MKLELNVPEDREFTIEGYCTDFRIEDGMLVYFSKRYGYWKNAIDDIARYVGKEITLLPWKPQKNERYYYINASSENGYSRDTNEYTGWDKRMTKRVTVYQTEEEVKAAVKELGWSIE